MDTKRDDAVQERVDKARRVVAFVGRPGATTDHTIVHLADALQAAESSRAEWQRTADAFALDVMEYLAEIQTLRARHTWLCANIRHIATLGPRLCYGNVRAYDSLDQLIDAELPAQNTGARTTPDSDQRVVSKSHDTNDLTARVISSPREEETT